MPSLLDPTDDMLSEEERKQIKYQNLFSNLTAAGLQAVAAGDNLYPYQRAQMLGQVAQTLGGIPGQQQQMLTNAAQQKLLGQKYAEKKRQDEFLKSDEFKSAIASMPPEYQVLARIDPVGAVTNWRKSQADDKRQAAADDRADKRANLELTLAQMKNGQPVVREVGGQLYRIYQDGRQPELIPTNGGKPLDNSARDDLRKVADPAVSLDRLTSTFKDDYAGKGLSLLGDVQNAYNRNSPFASQEGKDQATWWQDYQDRTNIVRKELFGVALSKHEQGEFDKANINPGMQPDVIKKNLQRQNEIVMGGLSRLANSLKESGYNQAAIETMMGRKFGNLPSPIQEPAQPIVQNGNAPVPQQGGAAPQAAPQMAPQAADPLEGRTATNAAGQKIIRRNGQWVPLQ